MYTVKFSDGTEITELECREFDLRRKEAIDKALFTPARMRDIEIVSDGEVSYTEDGEEIAPYWLTGKHDVLRFAGVTHDNYDDYWYLSLDEIPESVREREKLKGDIAYIAMMTGVDL